MKDYTLVSFRITKENHRFLKKLSFLTEKPISELFREGVEKIINDNKKVLTNSDITI